MKTLLWSLLTLSLATTAFAATTRNDDSCDIALLPAATLLLPYFEVDLDDVDGSTTLFTITNVTNVDQIARVTLWTDRAHPVINFDIYLTGYDVQSINLYDIIGRGIIAPEHGTGTNFSERGHYSDRNQTIQLAECTYLPGVLDASYVERMRKAFTEGHVPAIFDLPACSTAGGVHENAVGYATIDVVRKCSGTMPIDAEYWTSEIGYANALAGDYQHVRRGNRFADGGPMVHIRAVPEGGLTSPTFPRTFYSRFQASGSAKLDARQPLPSVFSARWINGGAGQFETFMKIWREAKASGSTTCPDAASSYPKAVEVARFDEAENVTSWAHMPCSIIFPCDFGTRLPSSSMTSVSDRDVFPTLTNGAIGGWMYMNLDQSNDTIASQAWMIASMRAEGQFSVDIDAIAFGNGCSAQVASSEISEGTAPIAPLPNVRTP